MIIKDQNGNEIDVAEIIFESENELLSIAVDEGKIKITLNDERILHDQIAELYRDDHKQYLDAVRHAAVDHSGVIAAPGLDNLENVTIIDPINEQVLTYVNGEWINVTPRTTRNHSLLDNLDKDDHTQYMHNDQVRIVTAAHVYDTRGAAFVLTRESIGALITGLNSEFLNGKKDVDFAPANHTHSIYALASHQHPGTDITSAVAEAINASTLGGRSPDQFADNIHTHSGSEITSRVPDSDLLEGHPASYFSQAGHIHQYAPIGEGVTGGNTHNHDGTTTSRVDHNNLLNKGTKTHADIDSHLQNIANPHQVTKLQVGLSNVDDLKQIPYSTITTKGDLIVGLTSGISRFGVGLNTYLLVADNTQPTGLRWASPSSIFGGPYSPLTHNHDTAYAAIAHNHNSAYSPVGHNHDLVYIKIAGGTMTGNLSMGTHSITGLADPVNSADAVTKSYVDSRTSGSTFAKAVIDILNDPPVSPTIGDRYIVGTAPTGAWTLYANRIAQKSLTGWDFVVPVNGTICPITEKNNLYAYDSTNGWYVLDITTSHSTLQNLSADDHTQYAHLTSPRTVSAVWTFSNGFLTSSTTLVENLNAELLNGKADTDFALVGHTHSEVNPTIVKYLMNDGTWDNPSIRFAPSIHSHGAYYTKTQLQTLGQSEVHYGNITNKPTSFAPSTHKTTHQAGGSDQLDVTGLQGILAQAQLAQVHNLISGHSISGLTTGHFLKALSATTFGFAAHGLTFSDVGAASAGHNHNGVYSPVAHNHNGIYSAVNHSHSDYALTSHTHDALYAAKVHTHSEYSPTTHDHNSLYAPIAKGVTNGDSHDHNGGDGAQLSHLNLSNIGTNTHNQIDTHISTANIHNILDDASSTNSNLWSALNIANKLGTKSATTHLHTGVYEPVISTKGTAFNKNYGTSVNDVKMDGTPSVGGTDALARIDHVHPTDTSRAAAIHVHIIADTTGLQAALNSKSSTSHLHTGVYEPANSNIQIHVNSAHAPANAQKNSDILKSEIEAVLTGSITSHTHSYSATGHTHTKSDITGLVSDLAVFTAFMNTKTQANGLASLGSDGKVPMSQLPASLASSLVYKGTFNGSSLPSNPSTGWVYICSVAGSGYAIGDWIIWNGSSWDKIDNTDSVTSVDGRTGIITLSDLYAALSHTHTIANITNLQSSLDGKAAAVHAHTISDVTGLQTALNGKSSTSHNHAGVYEPIISSKGTAFNKNYEATAANIKMDGTQAVGTLDTIARGDHVHPTDTSRAAAVHTHVIANVTGLQTALDGKALSSHTHADATTLAAGFMSAADKTKLNGLSNYVHPTTDGTLHVPATGTTNNGKVLRAGSVAGSIAWSFVDWSEIAGRPATYTPASHSHTQSQSHGSPDTDAALTSLHHTIGTGTYQAAAGKHAAQHKSGGVDPILLTDLGGVLTQAKTHASPDTDATVTSLHHTIGAGANQAAAGNHTHSAYALTSHVQAVAYGGTGLTAYPVKTIILPGTLADLDHASFPSVVIDSIVDTAIRVMSGIKFPASVNDAYAMWTLRMPKDYNGGTIQVSFSFIPYANCVPGTTLILHAVAGVVENGASIKGTAGAAAIAEITLTTSYTVNTLWHTAFLTVTPGGTPNGGDMMYLWLGRVGADTSAIDFMITEATVKYTTNSYTGA